MTAPLAVVVVGAGFGGLGMAIRLKQSGIDDFVILERAEELGGVWRDNRYPGVACDVPVHVYSFSFEPNPDWSRFFAPQREILAYLHHCAEKYGLGPHLRLGMGVARAEFDEARGLWSITTTKGTVLETRVLIAAAGLALTTPVLPDIPGLTTFEGKVFHSSRWDASTPLDGKRVAVIGTGASAIQIIPEVAKVAKQLHVFQRTAPWVMERPDFAIPAGQKALFRKRPSVQKLLRGAIWSLMEAFAVGFVVEPRINELRQKLATRYIAKQVHDPVLRANVTPPYTLGCKRILFSNDYYPSLQRPNVELVTERVREVRGRTLITADGKEREVDAIVCATGFEASEAPAPFELRGLGGHTLEEAWKDGVEAYLGATVAGFPNFFFIVGPNTGLGHSSMIFMIESQVAYVLDAIKTMRAKGLGRVSLRPEVQRAYNERLQERLARTVWSKGGCVSWYTTKAGKNTTLWPGFTFEFRARTRKWDEESYEVG
ncbi:MAG: NAD(P)/FAD-dependent oxidoreductase [Labilithrix sp.]|nr:NAD(P)/FAD-dependent oxidoreductase [Labilithrix sp.]